MPEQLDPRPADVVPTAPHPNGAAEPSETILPRPLREQLPPFLDPGEILYVSPLQCEVNADLRWAHEQLECGAFNAYIGKHLAIVNKTVQAVGDAGAVDEAAKKTGVPPERVALFWVGGE